MQGIFKRSVANLRNLKLITLDCTGTLLKFRRNPVEYYIEFGNQHGVTVNEELMARNFKNVMMSMSYEEPHFGHDWIAWWKNVVTTTFLESEPRGAATKGTFKDIAEDLIEHFKTAECWEVQNGVVEFLSMLESFKKVSEKMEGSTLQVGCISNFDPRLDDILRATDLHKYFDFVINSHSIQRSKPDRAIFKYALDTASKINTSRDPWTNPLLPVQALHIGNKHIEDFQGPTSAGWSAFLVMSAEDYAEQMHNLPAAIRLANPPVIFNNLLGILQHFETIAQGQSRKT